jgi:hypothetical protein
MTEVIKVEGPENPDDRRRSWTMEKWRVVV